MKLCKQKIQLVMATKCMNISDVCKASDIKYTMFRRIFNGGECKPKIVGKIAKALGVDVTEIIEM